jgi:signal transduction histidine kinase/DNA-binding response OmpR family regulator
MSNTISIVEISFEDDIVTARQRARQVARLLAFDDQDQTRISTALSEIARLFVRSYKGSRIEFDLEGSTTPQLLLVTMTSAPGVEIRASVSGNGADLEQEWEAALIAARRLMDQCDVRSDSLHDRVIRLAKILPPRAPMLTGRGLERLSKQLERQEPQTPIEEVRQQNQELLRALEELHERQQELVRLNGELEDTNRGVVALYAELDEKAGHLRRADEMKSRFLSNMSHEFRTPVNAILALSHLLLEHTDGELNSEQTKQVNYIRKSGESLLELVNDLLDLAKIEAGKVTVKPDEFEVANLVSALRGMLRPLLVSNAVNLVFDEPAGVPHMTSDEGKVSQILRNFVSNAIKFTERGEVRVSAAVSADGRFVAFSVADTGIGIAQEDQARIFEEFSQLDHPIQTQIKGTGLGLPLCRKLAQLLGGSVEVSSRPGEGSVFTASIPVNYAVNDIERAEQIEALPVADNDNRLPVLVVEDEPGTRLLYEKYLRNTPFRPIAAGSIRQAREQLRRHPVVAVVLDVLLPDEPAWKWLAELKREEATSTLPILVVSTVEDQRKGFALGADDYCVKPLRRTWLLDRLQRVTKISRDPAKGPPLVLVIDDQETDRYIIRHHLEEFGCSIVEADRGEDGLRLARQLKPALVLLDLNMPGMDGFEVLSHLRDDPATAMLPVTVVTSQILMPEQFQALAHARAVILKHELSPVVWQQVFRDAGFRYLEAPAPETINPA